MTHRTFEETQRFDQLWLWIVIVGASLLVSIQVPLSLIYAAGEEPMPTSSILVIIFSLVFVIGLNALFVFARLKTKIDSTGVSIIFKPFVIKPIIFNWDVIEKAFVRKYKPLWEYGGWGVRYRWNNRAQYFREYGFTAIFNKWKRGIDWNTKISGTGFLFKKIYFDRHRNN